MSHPLAEYVGKYILNPAVAVDVDCDWNEETRANVADRIDGEEGATGAPTAVSKLRLQNAGLLEDGDSRYKGKRTTRKDIKGNTELCDPDLAKYFLLDQNNSDDNESEERDEDNYSDEREEDEDSERDEDESLSKESDDEENILKKAKKAHKEHEFNEDFGLDDIEEEEDDLDEDSEIDNEEVYNEAETQTNNSNNVNDVEEDTNDEEEAPHKVKAFSTENTDEVVKGIAIKNQLSMYDALFEARIGFQKGVSIANQLPQFNSYQEFLKNPYYPGYKSSLVNCSKIVKSLTSQILKLQELLIQNNSLLNNENSNEESEDEAKIKKGLKRKKENIEVVLKKRQRTLVPFRDETLTKWHDKAKLLTIQSKGNFGSFDIPPVQQIQNMLANKEQLLNRTRLVGLSRGNIFKVLGKACKRQNADLVEEHDPEIFDDSDFYSRMLEDVLKSKISISEDMTEVSRKWIDIQKLRKKAKRTVDTKASKGRKLRFEVMSKLQQFLAPCRPAVMTDDATNQLFSNLFSQT